MPYWMVTSLFVLALAISTYEVFWQTGAYDKTMLRELVRLNRMAELRGDPPMALSTFREQVIKHSLALAATALKRRYER